MARTVRQYINEFEDGWDVAKVGVSHRDAVVWMRKFNAATHVYGHHVSRFDGQVQTDEEWPDSEERASEAFDRMCAT